MFPQCLSVASKASLLTRKSCIQLITSHDKKDCDGKTNAKSSNVNKAVYVKQGSAAAMTGVFYTIHPTY